MCTMGLRARFFRTLMRGTPPTLDPDEFVELAALPLFDATLLTERLRGHGVDASCVESYNVVSRVLSDGRVLVRRRQLAEAHRVWALA
jgi:hypothetical protein